MTTKRQPRIETYQGDDGQWYWRCRSANGRIILVGGEGYTRKASIARALDRNVGALCRAFLRERGIIRDALA